METEIFCFFFLSFGLFAGTFKLGDESRETIGGGGGFNSVVDGVAACSSDERSSRPTEAYLVSAILCMVAR